MTIPTGYQSVMPYLIIPQASAFSHFVQSVFGAIETTRTMRDETTIMHAEVTIGGSTIMFAEATEQGSQQPAGLFIYVPDADRTYAEALGQGAASLMPPSDQPYGRAAGVRDPFGNSWWITTALPGEGE